MLSSLQHWSHPPALIPSAAWWLVCWLESVTMLITWIRQTCVDGDRGMFISLPGFLSISLSHLFFLSFCICHSLSHSACCAFTFSALMCPSRFPLSFPVHISLYCLIYSLIQCSISAAWQSAWAARAEGPQQQGEYPPFWPCFVQIMQLNHL